jgi:hypothetical protein
LPFAFIEWDCAKAELSARIKPKGTMHPNHPAAHHG